ncbi:MAG: hypothetical protein ACKV19_03590, partial [Verrucomicrobiales bacterium]
MNESTSIPPNLAVMVDGVTGEAMEAKATEERASVKRIEKVLMGGHDGFLHERVTWEIWSGPRNFYSVKVAIRFGVV